MRRTQLYLDENVWKILQILARQSSSTVSELVRQAIREKYLVPGKTRQEVFQSVVGLWKNRTDLPATGTYIRKLRKGTRLKRLKRAGR